MFILRNGSVSSAWRQLSGIFDKYFSSQNSISTELDDEDDIMDDEDDVMDDEDDEPLQATLETGASECNEAPGTGAPKGYVRSLKPDPSLENHYILVIHGTYDSPPEEGSPNPTPWYFLEKVPGNFCDTLASQLEESVLGRDAIWRKLPAARETLRLDDIPYPFHWDGSNTHLSRIQAGKCLARLINKIAKSDPRARIHCIAHSHGGNVVLRAVDLYLSLLKYECARPYNRRIHQAFMAAYAQNMREIGHHYVPPGLPWFVTMWGPLAVYRWTWEKAPELGPLWFGYWKTTDHFFRLNRAREAKYKRNKWATSPSANALGKLVFLGTPFYSKYWNKYAGLQMSLVILSNSCVTMIMLFAFVFLARLLSSSGNKDHLLRVWTVWSWILCAIFSLLFVTIISLVHRRFENGNLYYLEKKKWSTHMQALVLNAGKLDEAALALSTEPLVRAYLMPSLKAMLTPDLWKSWRPLRTRQLKRKLYNLYSNSFLIAWNTIFGLPYLALIGLNYFLVPYFSNALLRLFMTLGFGLQKGELDHAMVYVEEYLRLDPATHNVQHWNVQKILTKAAAQELGGGVVDQKLPTSDIGAFVGTTTDGDGEGEEVSVTDRWRFLWDNRELNTKAEISATMTRLRGGMDKMRHNPRATRQAFERELKLICVTLEERYKEMTGNVKLSHGSYFRNPKVIRAVSHFLNTGSLPSWAAELGWLVDTPDSALRMCERSPKKPTNGFCEGAVDLEMGGMGKSA